MPLLEIEHLSVSYDKKGERNTVVHDVGFSVNEGEVVGLIGESGSGKSTIAKAIAGLVPYAGEIRYCGTAIPFRRPARFRKEIQLVFQDPYSSLNPKMRVEEIIAEPMEIHRMSDPCMRRKRVQELLIAVELSPQTASSYPSQCSGGQRQRIAIARALAAGPRLLVCDEALASVDAHLQEALVLLLQRLQKELNFSILFIGHQLPLINRFANRILVMNHGMLVEELQGGELFTRATHPHTGELIEAMPTFLFVT